MNTCMLTILEKKHPELFFILVKLQQIFTLSFFENNFCVSVVVRLQTEVGSQGVRWSGNATCAL